VLAPMGSRGQCWGCPGGQQQGEGHEAQPVLGSGEVLHLAVRPLRAGGDTRAWLKSVRVRCSSAAPRGTGRETPGAEGAAPGGEPGPAAPFSAG